MFEKNLFHVLSLLSITILPKMVYHLFVGVEVATADFWWFATGFLIAFFLLILATGRFRKSLLMLLNVLSATSIAIFMALIASKIGGWMLQIIVGMIYFLVIQITMNPKRIFKN